MQRTWRQVSIAVGLAACLLGGIALAEDAETSFARVSTDDEGRPQALQIAVATYVPQDPSRHFSVDLVGAVHIGDKKYYAELNDRFRGYDAVLYELVAPQGTIVIPEGSERKGILSNSQLGLTRMLGLSFQLDEIDYAQSNFVHADLSAQELSQSMDERGESLYVYFWRIFYATIDEYAKDPLGMRDWQALTAILKTGESPTLKTIVAYELTNLDSVSDILGEDSDSAVIGARNERAIEVLRNRLDSGDTRLGIFYGIGHMPDLEQRLLDMGLVRHETNWVDAWRLSGD